MRVLCCPDSLKGSLSASDAAAALAAGFRARGDEAIELPLADGGEGTAEALEAALGGEWQAAEVSDPLGRPVTARFLLLPDGGALVESADAIGLGRVSPGERDPFRASSRGLGELLLAAVEAGARHVIVALGGSATVDGGAGLREVVTALPVPVTVACDVRSPLLGPRGAARLFGPQKGASPAQVEELEARLAAMPELAPFADKPGAGAAGGLGAALVALGAELRPGAELVLETVGFETELAQADLVVTGEGTVDASTLEGKVPAAVAARCLRAGVECVVFGGRVDPDAGEALQELGATTVVELSGDAERAREDLSALASRLT